MMDNIRLFKRRLRNFLTGNSEFDAFPGFWEFSDFNFIFLDWVPPNPKMAPRSLIIPS